MGVGWHEKHQSRIGLWYKDMRNSKRNREVGDGTHRQHSLSRSSIWVGGLPPFYRLEIIRRKMVESPQTSVAYQQAE